MLITIDTAKTDPADLVCGICKFNWSPELDGGSCTGCASLVRQVDPGWQCTDCGRLWQHEGCPACQRVHATRERLSDTALRRIDRAAKLAGRRGLLAFVDGIAMREDNVLNVHTSCAQCGKNAFWNGVGNPQPCLHSRRTHAGRAGERTHLYLVRFPQDRYVKVGIGRPDRVRSWIRRGGEVQQVLEGPFLKMVAAERAIVAQCDKAPVVPIADGHTESLAWQARKIDLKKWVRGRTRDVTTAFAR